MNVLRRTLLLLKDAVMPLSPLQFAELARRQAQTQAQPKPAAR